MDCCPPEGGTCLRNRRLGVSLLFCPQTGRKPRHLLVVWRNVVPHPLLSQWWNTHFLTLANMVVMGKDVPRKMLQILGQIAQEKGSGSDEGDCSRASTDRSGQQGAKTYVLLTWGHF
mmetsp:Transcript_1483/g.3092  ORF Transcript_1483/g.3092 Transcript_1483/m.3092 type:complete len:117 (+) Transcript_1483:1557-1907(+)